MRIAAYDCRRDTGQLRVVPPGRRLRLRTLCWGLELSKTKMPVVSFLTRFIGIRGKKRGASRLPFTVTLNYCVTTTRTSASPRAGSISKNIAALLQIGVEGEHSGDNRKIHQDSKQNIRAYTKNSHYKWRQPKPVINLGYARGSRKFKYSTAPFPEIDAYTRQYHDSSGKRRYRVRIRIPGHQCIRSGKQSAGYRQD